MKITVEHLTVYQLIARYRERMQRRELGDIYGVGRDEGALEVLRALLGDTSK